MNPIRRIVQLVLDAASARRAGADAERSLSPVDRALQRIKRSAIQLGVALAGAFAVRSVIRFARESIGASAEAEAHWNRLAGSIAGVGRNAEEEIPRLRELARAVQDVTTVGDEETAAVLNELISTSGNYEESVRNLGVVLDLAAAKQIDLKAAAQLVGRAMVGQTATLTRYGIVVEEGADAVEVMRERFRGMAENEAKSLEGQIKQLSNEWGDLKEAVGAALTQSVDGESILSRLTETIKGLTGWVERNHGVFRAFGNTLLDVVGVVGFAWRTFQRLADIIVGSVTAAIGQNLRALALLRRGYARTAEAVAVFLDALPGGGGAADRVRDMAQFHADAADEMMRVADAIVEAGTNALRGRQMLDDALGPPSSPESPFGPPADSGGGATPDSGDGAASGGDGKAGKGGKGASRAKELDPITAALNDNERALRSVSTLSELLGQDYDALGERASVLEGTMRRLADAGVGPLDPIMLGLRDKLKAVQDEAKLTGGELDTMAGVATEAGDLLGAAFGGGIGQLANAKARQNALLAAENLAQGLVASLNPFTAPLAGKHFAAAAKFGAIAAGWRALASTAGGGGGASVSSAGGSASAGAGASSASGSRPGNELHIYFEGAGFDAVNPRVQQVTQSAIRNAEERQGANATVRVHRRNRS